MAGRGSLGGAEAMSQPPAPPLLLASSSPQRRAILMQLGIPFELLPPRYDEADPPEADALAVVREHARGKARSVAGDAGDRPVLGVDTAVVLGGHIYGKPADAGDAEAMLEALSGQTHAVVSGLCLVTPGWENGVDRQEVGRGLVADGRAVAAPGPRAGAFAQSRPDRVADDVAIRRKQLDVVLDDLVVEAILEQVPTETVLLVEAARVLAVEDL